MEELLARSVAAATGQTGYSSSTFHQRIGSGQGEGSSAKTVANQPGQLNVSSSADPQVDSAQPAQANSSATFTNPQVVPDLHPSTNVSSVQAGKLNF